MVTAEEAVAGALVLKNESHHSAENASNSDQEGNTPAVPKKPSEDGYNWRKYGQKSVKRNEYIRSYYKCSYHNCQVKKQVEHAHDGRITDTTYFGEHDHPKPQNNLPNTIPSVVSVKVQIADSRSSTVAEDNSSSAHPLMVEEVEPKDTNKLAIGTEGKDQAPPPPSETKDDENKNNKLVPKRRKKSSDDAEPVVDKPGNKSCHVVETVSAVDIVNDGYRWRKYGQKLVKGNQHPRSYYRCSNPGCLVKKHVERAFRDPKVIITTYEGKHIHDIPPVRTMLPHGKPPSLFASSDTVDGVTGESKGDVVEGEIKADERGVEAGTELQGEKVSQIDFDDVGDDEGETKESKVPRKGDVGDDEGETKESKVPRKGRPRKGRQLPKKTYPSRSRELAPAAKSPFRNMDGQKLAKKITKNSKVEGITKLIKWMQSESIEPRIGPTGQPLDKKFFEKLFASKVWLVSEHLEQMMFLYRQRISEDPKRFSKVVVLDAFWQTLVTIEFNRFQKDFPRKGENAVMKYMMGSYPTGFGKRWDDAERIYVPFNIPNSHCFALEIELYDWGVTVYDCNVDLYSDKKFFDMIQPVVQTVQRYVKMYEPLTKRCEPLLDKPMSVSRRDNIKQNKRGGDCGVYTLKHIELLMLGMTNLDIASDKFIDEHRNQMAHSIFRCWDGF